MAPHLVLGICLGQFATFLLLMLINFRLVEFRRKMDVKMPVDRLDYAMTFAAVLMWLGGLLILVFSMKVR